MAQVPITLRQVQESQPRVNRALVSATTDEDIRRHQIEDGEDPDAPLPREGK